MVKLWCRYNLTLCAARLVAVVFLFVSQLLVAQGGSVENPIAASSVNSIFSATIDLNTSKGVIKSENDKRSYRYIVLENQLRVLLISDPATEKSAAALDVNVGANQNPEDRAGLAHFLEHMLFLGTQKYPLAGEYQEFISQHGGSFNAYTAAENTNYFFDIDNDQLDPALDRFAQFFIAPLFSAGYVERERNAVNSEYLAKLKDDGRREWDVYRELMNPQHPSAKFSVGNLTTLADREWQPVRDDMIAFYRQHYSSHLMNLVVLGRDNLDALEKGVRARFSAIPRRDINISSHYPSLFDRQRLPASVAIKPEKELRQLTFNFPIPNPDQFYEKKPFVYIASLVGHEAEGSLLSLLKRLGWADALYTSIGLQSRKDAVFQLSIQLTPRGVRARDQIVSVVFHFIEHVRQRGISPWRFNELQKMADFNFRFQEKRAPIETVSVLAESMKRYAPRDILRGDYLYSVYDERLIKKSMSYLNKDNLLLVLTAPDIEPYRVSALYSVPFSARSGIPELLDLKPVVRRELFLPEENLFLPKRLSVKAISLLNGGGTTDAGPKLILDTKNMRVWYAQDQQFMQPRATINLRIKSPLVASGVEGAAQAQLFAALISDQLNEYVYAAKLAGIDYDIVANSRGYDVNIAGYSSRQGLLLSKIMDVIRAGEFKEARFSQVKENVLRSLRNQNKDFPYQVLAKQIPVLQLAPNWNNAQLIAALEHKTAEEFAQFSGRQLLDAKMDALFYGNYFRAEALKLAVLVEHQLLSRQTGRDIPPIKLLLLPKGADRPWLYTHALEHSDKVVELLIQSPTVSIDDTAHMMLVRQLLQPAFYNQLRTEKQFGYVVGAFAAPLANLENSLLVVQSPSVAEDKIIQEIDSFLAEQYGQLLVGFDTNQQSLIKMLREPARSLKEQGERYWSAITNYDNQFSRRLDLAEAVARITPDSLNDFYREVFMDKNRRLWIVSGEIDGRDSFFNVKDLAAHKQRMNVIARP